jgi:SNF2 family DNA or RNA helicase
MQDNTIEIGVINSRILLRVSSNLEHNIILMKTLNSIISNMGGPHKALQDSYELMEITLPSNEITENLLTAVQELCSRQNITLIPLNQKTEKVLKRNTERIDQFSIFRNAAIIARNNQALDEYTHFCFIINKFLTRELRDYQYKSAFFATQACMSCNFSVPGSGKTTVAYAVFAYLNQLPIEHLKHVDKVLVIGPISSFEPWRDEFIECFGDKRKPSVKILSGLQKLELETYCKSMLTEEVTVVNFEKVRVNEKAFKEFLNRNRTLLIIDEVHRMKNPTSITARTIKKLVAEPTAKIFMTGTPMPNGYEDLYTLFSYLWPKHQVIKFSYEQLRQITKSATDSLWAKPSINQLLKDITPFFIRTTKNMLKLPPPEPPIIMKISLSQAELELYNLINRTKIFIDPNDYTSQKLLRAKLIRLMQVSTNPNLLNKPLNKISHDLLFGNSPPEDSTIDSDYNNDNLTVFDPIVLITSQTTKMHITNLIKSIGISSKLRETVKLIEELVSQGNKVIVWTIFIQTMTDLKRIIRNELGFNVELLNGATRNIRPKILESFKYSDELPIVIANPSAVSESISLHKCCHHAIYVDMSYNAVHYIQSKDRIHRLGLPPNTKTFYYYLQSEDTIDEKVYSRVVAKETRMTQAIENELPPIFEQTNCEEIIEDLGICFQGEII